MASVGSVVVVKIVQRLEGTKGSMMGNWVYREADNHKCQKPPGGHDVKIGDIWRCDCGKLWRVTKNQHKGDQRDSWWDIAVEEYHGEVPKQNQPIAVRKPVYGVGGIR